MSISTDRTRDPGILQLMLKCPPGSHKDWPFLTDTNAPTQTRPHSTHLRHSYSPHFDLSPRNRLWVIDFQFSGFYPQWFEYAGMLPAWDWARVEYYEWITTFVAGNYRKQRMFLLNVDWAVNVGHLIR